MRQNVFLFQSLCTLLLWTVGPVLSSAVALPSSAVRSLTGVTTVRVVVEDLSETIQQTGLRKEQLAALAVDTLQKSGVTVLTVQDRRRVPIVYIRLSSVSAGGSSSGPMSFYLTLQMKQLAILTSMTTTGPARPPVAANQRPLLVTTWENGTMAMVNPSELFFYVKHTLINLIGELVYEQKLANDGNSNR